MPKTYIVPPEFQFLILNENEVPIGQACFDLVSIVPGEIETPRPRKNGEPNPNTPLISFVTKRGLLRAEVAGILGIEQKRIHRAFIGTGTWLYDAFKGQGHGRRAMTTFLNEWANIADLVVIRAFPTTMGNDSARSPNQRKLAEIWESVGFRRKSENSFTLYYAP